MCVRCKSEYLQNPNEFECCLEIEECVECLSSQIVVEEFGTKPKCVTKHPGFSHKHVLFCHRFLHGIAYREFTRLVHGYLGGRQIPLPACSYHAMRKTFPV